MSELWRIRAAAAVEATLANLGIVPSRRLILPRGRRSSWP
jgi:hypothetical protein